MIKKIKEYFEYKRNVRIAKRELAQMMATTLPTVRLVLTKGADIVKFIANLTNETKNIKGERLVEMVLDRVSATLQTDNNRLVEVLTYIANLQPEEMRKILIHSMIETNPEIETEE